MAVPQFGFAVIIVVAAKAIRVEALRERVVTILVLDGIAADLGARVLGTERYSLLLSELALSNLRVVLAARIVVLRARRIGVFVSAGARRRVEQLLGIEIYAPGSDGIQLPREARLPVILDFFMAICLESRWEGRDATLRPR